ncbi:hypothetical protein Vretimale_18651 [Volvox reticuliferus]|nr:hypothetical protein Vretimale_18651 [Volvox reticuliferus]
MVQVVLIFSLLAANFAVSQDLPLDLQRPLGRRQHESSNLRTYKDWIEHLFLGPTNSTKEPLLFPDTQTCNHTICCSTRTSDSLARRAERSAALLRKAGPPSLLACGPKGDDTATITVPCHAPMGSQAFLQAAVTRFRLMFHCRNHWQLYSRTWIDGSTSFGGLHLLSAVRKEYSPFHEENEVGANSSSLENGHRNGSAINASELPAATQSPTLENDEATPLQLPILQDDNPDLREAISIVLKALHSVEGGKEVEQLHQVFNAAALLVGLQGKAGQAAESCKDANETVKNGDEATAHISIMQGAEHEARSMEGSMNGEQALEQEKPNNITEHIEHDTPPPEDGMGPGQASDQAQSSMLYIDDICFADNRTGAVSALEAETYGDIEEGAPHAVLQTEKQGDLAGQPIAVATVVRQWVVPRLVMVLMAIAAVAVMFSVLMSLHVCKVDRRMLRLRVAGQESARAHEQLRNQHDALVLMLVSMFVTNRELRDQMEDLRTGVKQQRILLRAALHQTVMIASASSATAVDLVQGAVKLQQTQGELAGALSTAVQEWRKRGEMFAASLSFCRRRVEVVVQKAAMEKAAAPETGRAQDEEAKHVFEELEVERQRHLATAAAAQAYRVQCRRMLRDLRGRFIHNIEAWIKLRTQLLSLHEMRAGECSLVKQYQRYVAKLQQQLAAKRAALTEVKGRMEECYAALEAKEASIMSLYTDVSTKTSAVENHRQQSADLQRALTKADEDLSAANEKVKQLEVQLQEAQAAARIAEARTESLSSINECLEQQCEQVGKALSLLEERERAYLAPTRARAMELEQQIEADKAAAKNAKAEDESKIFELDAKLQQIQREAKEKDRIIAELTMQVDDDKRHIQMMQTELQRRMEEGKVASAVALPNKQSLMTAERMEQCDRDQLVQALVAQLYQQWQPLPVDRVPAQAIAADAAAVIVSTLDRGNGTH